MTENLLRLLLVEDKKHDYALAKRSLEKSHLTCEIVWVQKGDEALKLLHAQAFDVVTLDYNLPDMNGLEVFEQLVDQQVDVPVVFVTGSGNEMVAVEAMRKGAQHYLVKDPAGQYLELLPAVVEKAHQQWQDRRARHLAEKMEKELALEHERMRILSEFITKASHEFRTPLSVMKTSLYLMSRSTDSNKQQQYSERIESQIDNLSKLVDDAVTMARLDGTSHFLQQPIQLNAVISQLQAAMQSAIDTTGHTLILNLDENLPEIQGDMSELALAFEKLLDNALRYTQSAGTITLYTFIANQMVCAAIQDTGMGMTAEVMERIFERFYRADEAHSTRGFGLGLPIARAIIEKHGGKMTVESIVGQGSTFKIFLPIQ